MTTSVQEVFQADCVSWNGYKPCSIQKAENRPDCFGCEQYEAGPVAIDLDSRPFSADMLETADAIGIVEMGGLGSVLRTTAVTNAIRKANPDASMTWFTHQRGAELLKYVPGVRGVDVESVPTAQQNEMINNLDVLLNFELADAAKDIVAKASHVGGFILNAQGKFHGVYPHADYFQRLQIDDEFRKHNTLTMQEILLRSVGLGKYEAKYDIELPTSNHDNAEQLLHEAFNYNRPSEIIGLNIGTSEKGRVKRWPAERYARLAKRITDIYPYMGVAILSGPEDDEVRRNVVAELDNFMPDNVAVLPDDVEVGNFVAMVSKLRLVVSADTFGMHAARSQNIQTIALAGPMPHREMELSPRDSLIGPQTDCSPCYNRCSHAIESQCMKDIGVELVMAEITRNIAEPPTDSFEQSA